MYTCIHIDIHTTIINIYIYIHAYYISCVVVSLCRQGLARAVWLDRKSQLRSFLEISCGRPHGACHHETNVLAEQAAKHLAVKSHSTVLKHALSAIFFKIPRETLQRTQARC